MNMKILTHTFYLTANTVNKVNESQGNRRPRLLHRAPGWLHRGTLPRSRPRLHGHQVRSLACGRDQAHHLLLLLFVCRVHPALHFSLDQEPSFIFQLFPWKHDRGEEAAVFPAQEATVVTGLRAAGRWDLCGDGMLGAVTGGSHG